MFFIKFVFVLEIIYFLEKPNKTMKLIAIIIAMFSACFGKVKTRPVNMEAPNKTFYDFSAKAINGKPIDFSKYKGKKVLVVNVASECGYTPQYKDLEALNEKHGDKVVILAFPSNEFGGQEPGSNAEIAKFCSTKFGVKFQMFEKVMVKKGKEQSPLYQWLTNKANNGWNDQDPTWNFCKYLINEKGELEKFFPSKVNPMSEEIIKAIGA